MLTYYENFIRYGDPNGDSNGDPHGDSNGEAGGEWELFDPDRCNVMELGEHVGMITDPFGKLYPIIDRFQEELLKKATSAQ